jgi:hypothetical protein
LNGQSTSRRESIPVSEYIREPHIPVSHLAHDWEMHSDVMLTPAEERTMVREPAQCVPAAIAQRVGKVRVLLVPYVACLESGDVVSFTKPNGETHSAVWLEQEGWTHLVLACRELDPHDTGFEFLASVSELLRPKLTPEEIERYTQLIEEELREGVQGEIDEDAAAAKHPLLKTRTAHRRASQFENYRNVSFVSTVAEYMHGLWHDVQIRVGPEHLPVAQLRRRMNLLAEMFPPNPGFKVFAEGLEQEE